MEGYEELDIFAEADSNPADQRTTHCPHSVYIPADERPTGKSSYCGVCNPNAYGDEILHRTLAKKRIVSRPEPVEREIDAAEFMEQPISTRLASTREFFA